MVKKIFLIPFFLFYINCCRTVVACKKTYDNNNAVLTQPKDSTQIKSNVKKNRLILSLNAIHIVRNETVSMGLEKIFSKKKIGVKLSLSYFLITHKPFAMVDMKIYLNKERRLSYSIGPSLRFGIISFREEPSVLVHFPFVSILHNAGLSYQVSKWFNVSLDIAMGMGYSEYKKYFYDANANLGLGFTF